MDRFGQAPPHCLAFGQYGKTSCLWHILFEKFCVLCRQIGYSYTALPFTTAMAVSSKISSVPAHIGGW